MKIAVAKYAELLNNDMGEEIPQKQRKLEEYHACAPDQITASEFRQEGLGDDQFNLKE